MKNRRTGKFLLALIMSVAMIFTMGISTSVFAADGSGSDDIDPEVSKTLTPNGDGTYTLSLSVTGKTKEVTTKTKANVLIIMDTSGSMDFAAQDETGSKGSDGNGRSTFQLYKKVGNSYVEITDSEKYTGTVYRRNNNKYSEYTGTRFSSSQKRINVARTATNDLIDSLAKNNATVNDTVEICFMTFDSTANSETDWYKGTVMSDLKNKVVQKSPGGGTNWDDALHEARRVAAAKNDGDPTYIIFVSDGNPTYYYDNNHNERKGTGQEDEENVKKSAAPAYAEADLIKAAGYKFYGVGAFGSVDRMQTLCEKANGTYQNYYYAATDQTALEQAFAAIVNSISDSAGSKDVTITDNVTELTSTNQNLTELDTDSFTYTRSDNKAYTGPKATYDGSKVTWNLGDGYMLEDGVTYTVSFRVWPSQAAYDLVAALNNGTQSYDSLDPDVKSQIKKDGNSYSLYSNTKNTASDVNNKVDYTKVEVKESKNEPAGTKNADGTITGTDGFTYEKKNNVWIGTKESRASQALTNPDPMPLTGTKMTVKKEWVGAPASGSVFFELMQDDEGTGKIVELKSGNEWSAEVNIAPGLIVGDETLEPGHNYTLEEVVPEGETADYHYEFDSETHHPMLKKVGNNMAIVDLNDDVKDNVLVGTNTRKSTLDISKTVTGIQNSSKTFTYKVKIKDNNGDDIWFSIAKGDSIVKEDGRISGDNASQVTAEENAQGKTGYYSVPSNTEFNISIKDGENIRFINLPVDSTYSVEEIGMPADGYSFDKVDLNKVATDDNAVKSGAKVTGIIKSANSAYELDYTNKYSVTPVTENLHATKKVEGNDATEAFTFSIEATGDNAGNVEIPSATATTGTTPLKDGDQKTVDFNNIKFKAPGTYTFKVKETNTNVPGGWTYDNQNAKTITVKVEDKSGQLTVTEVSDTPVFTNSYDAEDTTATIEANKKLTGLDLEENLFKFQLYDSNNHEIGAPVGNAANGKVTFPEISYDAVGTYKYKIKEVVPEVVDADNKILAGMTYDISTVNVTVEVTDNEGKLEADVSYADNDNTFENYYASGSAFIQGLKVVDNGAVALEGGEFEFTISSTNGGRLPDETTVANKAGGIIEFGDIEFTLADLKAAVDEPTNDDNNNENNNTVEGTEDTEGEATLNAEPEGTEVEQPAAAAGKTYHYVITESKKVDGVINDGPQEFDIKITDDGEGGIDAEIISDGKIISDGENAFTFHNTFVPTVASPMVAKSFIDKKTEADVWGEYPNAEFKFDIAPVGNAPMKDINGDPIDTTVTTTKDSRDASFGGIVFDEPGTYHYTIKEQRGNIEKVEYDTTQHDVQVDVTKDNSTYELSAEVTYDNGKNNLTVVNELNRPNDAWIKVTKYVITDNGTPLTGNGSYYVGLFYDQGLTRAVEVKEIKFDNASSAYVEFHVPKEQHFYVAETDKDGTPLEGSGTTGTKAFQISFVDPTDEDAPDSLPYIGEVTSSSTTTKNVDLWNMYGNVPPPGFWEDGTVEITKNVVYDNNPVKVNDTFYVTVFEWDEETGEYTNQLYVGDDKEKLAIAKIELSNASSNADPATITDIPYGKYMLKETDAYGNEVAAPKYAPSFSNDGKFEVKDELEDYTFEFTLINSIIEPEVELTPVDLPILKVDANTEDALEGAIFTITNDETNESWTTKATGEDGKTSFEFTEPGEYTITETTPPSGYYIGDVGPWKVTVSEGGYEIVQKNGKFVKVSELVLSGDVEVVAKNLPTSLTVTKNLKHDDGGDLEDYTAKEASFYIALYSDKELTNQVTDVKKLTFNDSATSNTVTFTGLEADTEYYVGETDASGKLLKPVVTMNIDGKNYRVEMGPNVEGAENVATTERGKDNNNFVFDNILNDIPDRKYTELSLTKKVVDSDNNAHKYSGTFYITLFTDAEKTEIYKTYPITLKNQSQATRIEDITKIPLGTYYVAETDANGNIVDSKFKFTPSFDKESFEVNVDYESVSITLTNKAKPGTFVKTGDSTNLPLPLILMILAMVGAGAALFAGRRRKQED